MKIQIIALNMIFAILLSTFLYSALNIDLEVSPTRAASYTLRGGDLLVNVPVSVRNGGMYPVENIHIESIMENKSCVVWKDEFFIRRIDAFHTYTGNFILKINLTKLYEKLGSGFTLNGGELTLKILVHANYWILAEVNAVHIRKVWWDSLIKVFEINTSGIKIENNQIIIPYLLKTNAHLRGNISFVIRDSEGIVAEGSSSLICGKVATAELNLIRNFNKINSGEWNITAIVNIGTLKITKQVSYDFNLQNLVG